MRHHTEYLSAFCVCVRVRQIIVFRRFRSIEATCMGADFSRITPYSVRKPAPYCSALSCTTGTRFSLRAFVWPSVLFPSRCLALFRLRQGLRVPCFLPVLAHGYLCNQRLDGQKRAGSHINAPFVLWQWMFTRLRVAFLSLCVLGKTTSPPLHTT